MKWDHVVAEENNSLSDIQAVLEQMGEQGWELVSAVNVAGNQKVLLLFKQPLRVKGDSLCDHWFHSRESMLPSCPKCGGG